MARGAPQFPIVKKALGGDIDEAGQGAAGRPGQGAAGLGEAVGQRGAGGGCAASQRRIDSRGGWGWVLPSLVAGLVGRRWLVGRGDRGPFTRFKIR